MVEKAMPTKAEWVEIESRINGFLYPVDLLCDGYIVSMRTVRIKQKLVVETFVDRVIEPAWIVDSYRWDFKEYEPEVEQAKFFPQRTEARYTAKEVKREERIFGKIWCRRNNVYAKPTRRDFYHSTAKAAIRHLKSVCTHIHWLHCDRGDWHE